MKGGVSRFAGRWGLCPQTPGIFRVAAKMAEGKTSGRPQLPPPRATSATESALGLRPRRAPPADFYCRQVSACAVFPLTNAPNTYASDVYSGAV